MALPDLVSNSYFPAIAAVELGMFKECGLDVSLEMVYPAPACYDALRDCQVDLVAGSAHLPLGAFPGGIVNSNGRLMSKAKYRIVARLRLDYSPVTGLVGRRRGPTHGARTAYNVQAAGPTAQLTRVRYPGRSRRQGSFTSVRH